MPNTQSLIPNPQFQIPNPQFLIAHAVSLNFRAAKPNCLRSKPSSLIHNRSPREPTSPIPNRLRSKPQFFAKRSQIPNFREANKFLKIISSDFSYTKHSYSELDADSSRFANILSTLQVEKGEKIFVILPKCYEQYFIFLGSLKHNCIVVPNFYTIGESALIDRLTDCGASIIITTSANQSKIKRIKNKISTLKYTLITDMLRHKDDFFLSLPLLLERSTSEYTCKPLAPDLPILIHYTSGSTGKPKGVIHVYDSISFQKDTFAEVFSPTSDDIYWCTAEQAWITGSVYGVFAPIASMVNIIQYVGGYDFDNWLKVLKDFKVTLWYTAPTALRMLMRDAKANGCSFIKTSLKRIYSVGEPLNPEIIRWCKEFFGVEVYDTWFQTETGAIMIANRPNLPIKPGSMGKPISNIEAAILDKNGKECPPLSVGELAIKSPWGSMFRNYLNNESAYKNKFINGYYLTGDKTFVDSDGYFWFKSRNDDVINTGGHLVSPFEVESILLEIDEVIESAVVGVPDNLLYEKVVAFVVAKKGTDKQSLSLKIKITVSNKLSTYATPQEIIYKDNIPKTMTGKIMRRLLRAEYLGEDFGDVSTLEEDL